MANYATPLLYISAIIALLLCNFVSGKKKSQATMVIELYWQNK
jgi:hypothetical protein